MNKIRIFPIFLITIGIIFLLGNLNIISNAWGKLWPLLLIIWGIGSIFNSLRFSNE